MSQSPHTDHIERDLDWAMSMLLHESDQSWKRFNTYLVSNSITLAASFSLRESYPLISFSLYVFGLVLCSIWYASTARGVHFATFYKHWIGANSQGSSCLINDAADLQVGKPVSLVFRGTTTVHKLPWFHPILKNQFYPYALIALFSILYIFLAAFTYFFYPPPIANCTP